MLDPITGQGIGDAFRDAELLTDAIVAGLSGDRPDRALAGYRRKRDKAALPMYRFTGQLARLAPMRAADRELFAALSADPRETHAFFGVLTGVRPPATVFTPPHLIRRLGLRGFLRLARH